MKTLEDFPCVKIGNCTLYQGDCREILPLLGKVDAVVTDPPYGMSFKSNHRIIGHRGIANDNNDELLKWACQIEVQHSKYVFCRWDNIYEMPKPKSLVTWVKNNWSMGDLLHEHARQTEVALFYDGPEHEWGCGRPTDVVMAARTSNEYHPTEKPVELMQKVLKWTKGAVFDPFMGSGTTGVACIKMGRHFIGIELDPDYFQIAVQRIKDAHAQPDMLLEAGI